MTLVLFYLVTDCGKKYIIENGKVDFERKNTKYKSKIPVKCNKGYALLGEKEITCQKNGRWSERTMCRLLGKYTICYSGYLKYIHFIVSLTYGQL